MEESNYRDDFEHFLKETADEFRMVPSRKVWYSIYNGMHPDRRWPSITICLLILVSVLYIGISNNNSLSNAARKANEENFNTSIAKKDFNNPNSIIPAVSDIYKNNSISKLVLNNNLEKGASTQNNINTISSNNIPTHLSISKNKNIDLAIITNINLDNEGTKKFLSTADKTNVSITNNIPVEEDDAIIKETFTIADVGVDTVGLTAKNKILAEIAAEDLAKQNIKKNSIKNSGLLIEKAWKEDYAFRNKPALNRFKQNAGITYYITPSIGYRGFYKTNESKYSGSLLIVNDYNNKLLYDLAALNLEAGFAVHYNISKQFRIKSGLQSNYTNYISHVTELAHPTQAALAVNSTENTQRSSSYSTAPGKTKLNRTTLQLAIPIGADVRIIGNDKLKWFIGATLQPTYIISGNSYVLSADGRHYISEAPLLRKVNLNTSVETFVSFKASPAVLISVGPQFRYQLLSTYKSSYNYSEKLYNVGVKVGISTTF